MLQNFLKCFPSSEEQDLSSDDSESISSDKLASSDDDTENNPTNSFGLPTTKKSCVTIDNLITPSMKGSANGFTSAI